MTKNNKFLALSSSVVEPLWKQRSLYGTFVELSEFRFLMFAFQNPPLCVGTPTGCAVYVHRNKKLATFPSPARMSRPGRVWYKVFHRSNQMYELKHFGMVWQRRTREKCCGAQRKPFSSPFAKFAKGLEKYRNNERRHWELWLNS